MNLEDEEHVEDEEDDSEPMDEEDDDLILTELGELFISACNTKNHL